MIYCVVPEAMADELYDKLVEYYVGDPNVKVIVDRRMEDRRAGEQPLAAAEREAAGRREKRDRRTRARVSADATASAAE